LIRESDRTKASPGLPHRAGLLAAFDWRATTADVARDAPRTIAVIPAQAGIQYAAAPQLNPGLLLNTGSSAFADDDSQGEVAFEPDDWLQIYFSNSYFIRRHDSAISPRLAREFY
jgi:hypothetical protein